MHHLFERPAAGAAGDEPSRGIDFPRRYDLLVRVLTRGRERRFREAVLSQADLAPGRRVLDVGCGTGTQAIAAWRRVVPGGTVTGLDLSEKMLAAAARKAGRAGADIAFRAGEADRLPFDDRSFDRVMMVLSMHMVPESRRTRTLGEAARVLRPDGRLLLVDYAGDPARRRHVSARHGRHGRFDLDALRAPMAAAGFSDFQSGPLGWLGLFFLRGTRC